MIRLRVIVAQTHFLVVMALIHCAAMAVRTHLMAVLAMTRLLQVRMAIRSLVVMTPIRLSYAHLSAGVTATLGANADDNISGVEKPNRWLRQ